MLLSKNSTRVLSLAKHAANAASQVKKTRKACLPFNASQIRTMKFESYSVEDFDTAAERRGMNDDDGKILTPEGVAEINNKPLPAELIPQPVVYNGKQQFRTAYVLMRMPRMSPEEHPLDVEFFNLQKDHYMQTKDHNYEYFTEYYEAWKKQKKPSDDSKRKGGSNVEVRTSASGKVLVSEAKSKAKAAITRLTNAAPWTDQQKIDFARNLGQGMPTPLTENWLKNWKPASRYTEADFNDNRKSLFRKLNQRLYFVVKSRKTGRWKFPDMVRFNPMTLRLSAELLFKYQMKKNVYGHFLSNSPMAHYESAANSQEKTYFFSAIYVYGVPPFKELKKYYSDHAWVTRQELLELEMVDESYKRVAYDMLWDSGFDCMLDPEEYRGLLSTPNQVSIDTLCEQYFNELKSDDRLPPGMLAADVLDDGKHEPE